MMTKASKTYWRFLCMVVVTISTLTGCDNGGSKQKKDTPPVSATPVTTDEVTRIDTDLALIKASTRLFDQNQFGLIKDGMPLTLHGTGFLHHANLRVMVTTADGQKEYSVAPMSNNQIEIMPESSADAEIHLVADDASSAPITVKGYSGESPLLMQPQALIVRVGESIQLDGMNFIEPTYVNFGGHQVKATVVNSNRIQVTIPSEKKTAKSSVYRYFMEAYDHHVAYELAVTMARYFTSIGIVLMKGGSGQIRGYSDTPQGKVIVAAFVDAYANLVAAVKDYKSQTVRGGLGKGGNLRVAD